MPPGKTEISYVFNNHVAELECDFEEIQDFFKTLKDMLLILQND
jgi:hypothetical protein